MAASRLSEIKKGNAACERARREALHEKARSYSPLEVVRLNALRKMDQERSASRRRLDFSSCSTSASHDDSQYSISIASSTVRENDIARITSSFPYVYHHSNKNTRATLITGNEPYGAPVKSSIL